MLRCERVVMETEMVAEALTERVELTPRPPMGEVRTTRGQGPICKPSVANDYFPSDSTPALVNNRFVHDAV
jgi:hypothetical protein